MWHPQHIFFAEKSIPVACGFCTKRRDLVCATFNGIDGDSLPIEFCAVDKCEKDEDCTTLDDKTFKHMPPKCDDKKCIYNFKV